MMKTIIDLRSDTVTQPTPAMREAMAKAEVGDDVFGEDPSVNHLEELSAQRMGKEAGLFVPSGTMGNLTAILAHCGRGDEVMMGDQGHTFLFEAGGVAALGGVHPRPLTNQSDGTLKLEDIRNSIRADDPHFPISRLVVLENTHNRCGGVILSIEYTRFVSEFVHSRHLFLHLDGARIFNASVALGVAASSLAGPADSVTFCLSKGLCAPVGSVLCGSKDFIARARRIRKQLGGGMRQAGFLAAAGIYALENMVDRLSEDHRRAKKLAEGLGQIPGLLPDTLNPSTNMVFINMAENIPEPAKLIAARLDQLGIKVMVSGERRFRLVTHYWIDDQDIDLTVRGFSNILKE